MNFAIIFKSNVDFNIALVSRLDSAHNDIYLYNTGPVIYYGEWVKIKFGLDKIGYVANQYLLNLKPLLSSDETITPIAPTIIDTIYSASVPNDKSQYLSINFEYLDSIKRFDTGGSSWYSSIIEFKDFTIHQIMIIMGISNDSYYIHQN